MPATNLNDFGGNLKRRTAKNEPPYIPAGAGSPKTRRKVKRMVSKKSSKKKSSSLGDMLSSRDKKSASNKFEEIF